MARHNKKGRSKSGQSFFMLRHDILKSEAWLSLNPSSRAVLIQLMGRFNSSNNGFIGASVRDLADECNIAIGTVTTAIKTLEAVGFIVTMRKGGFSCKVKLASEYRLTWIKCDKTGHKPSDDFKAFKAALVAKKVSKVKVVNLSSELE